MAGVWERLEGWLLALQRDRARAAKLMLYAYWVSTAFAVLGGILIMLILAGVVAF